MVTMSLRALKQVAKTPPKGRRSLTLIIDFGKRVHRVRQVFCECNESSKILAPLSATTMAASIFFDGRILLQDGLLYAEPSLGGLVKEDCCVMENQETKVNTSDVGSEGSIFSLINQSLGIVPVVGFDLYAEEVNHLFVLGGVAGVFAKLSGSVVSLNGCVDSLVSSINLDLMPAGLTLVANGFPVVDSLEQSEPGLVKRGLGVEHGLKADGECQDPDALRHFSNMDGVRPKRPKQVIRKLDKPVLLVVGVDVCLNDIVLTNTLTLVGRFNGRKASAARVNKWVGDLWKDYVTQLPEVFLLPRGWLAFKFFFVADASVVLAGSWKWDGASLSLKR